MLRVGAGQSSKPSAELAAQEAATQAMSHGGLQSADAVVVFFTVDYVAEAEKLTATIRRITDTDRIVGCSALGVLSDAGEIEGTHGISVLAFASDQIRARPVFFSPLRGQDQTVGAELARKVSEEPGKNSLLVLLPDTYNTQPRHLLEGIRREGFLPPVVGAGCSENGSAGRTFQLCGDQLASNAVSGFFLEGSSIPVIGITQGCQPITEPKEITRAEGNLIFEINHRPAFEVFSKIVKPPLLEDLRRTLAFVFVGLPSDAQRNSVASGEYLVRNIVGMDPQKGVLAVAEEVHDGEKLIFTLRDGQRAKEDLEQMLQRLTKALEGNAPRFGFYFNCCARGTGLYGIPGIDTAYIRKALGDFPFIGFFGNFELGPLGEANRLLAYTGVLVVIIEQ
jgi:small ligand-binding sensory domain FIST